jgi:hypothetical protein
MHNEVTYSEELTSVLVSIVYSDTSAVDAHIETDSEVSWEEWLSRTILFQNHLSLQENTLWGATVGLFWLVDHDGVILQVVQDDQLSDSVVFKSALDDALLEVAQKSEDLYNKINLFVLNRVVSNIGRSVVGM